MAVHLRDDAGGFDGPDLGPECRLHGVRVEELQEGRLDVHVGEDRAGVDPRAVPELHPRDPALLREDAPHAGRRADRRAKVLGRLSEGLADASHPALRVPEDLLHAVDLMEEHVAEHEGRARRPGPGRQADRRRRHEGRLDLLGLEELVEEGRGTLEQQAPGKLLGLPAPEHADKVREGRGRPEDHGFDELHDLGPEPDVRRVGFRVLLREAGKFLVIPPLVVPEKDRVAIREGQEELGVEGMGLVSELRELEISDDLGAQEARGVRKAGEPDPGEDLLRCGRAADHGATLAHENAQARLCEVARRDEAVVPPADEDCVERRQSPPSSAPGRCLPVAIVLVGGHGLVVVDPPRPVFRGALPESPRHLPDVHGEGAAAGPDEVDAHRPRRLRVGSHVPS